MSQKTGWQSGLQKIFMPKVFLPNNILIHFDCLLNLRASVCLFILYS